jgi:hypothetical protein
MYRDNIDIDIDERADSRAQSAESREQRVERREQRGESRERSPGVHSRSRASAWRRGRGCRRHRRRRRPGSCT